MTTKIPIDYFSEINNKFKKVTYGEIIQTLKIERVVLETFVFRDTKTVSAIDGLLDIMIEKMLHLSYRYSLWDLCLNWNTHPTQTLHISETKYINVADISIYKEIQR